MSDEELLKDTSSAAVFDASLYSKSNYPDKYLPDPKSSCRESTEGLKSVRITREYKPQEVVVRISAKLMSRKEQVRRINEAIKRSLQVY